MINACLTHRDGTSNLGLYRGLKMKADPAGLDVYASTPSIATFDRWPLPAIVSITLPRLQRSWLAVGGKHSIVILRRKSDGSVEIADPFAGRQVWTRQQLAAAYAGTLMSLSPPVAR